MLVRGGRSIALAGFAALASISSLASCGDRGRARVVFRWIDPPPRSGYIHALVEDREGAPDEPGTPLGARIEELDAAVELSLAGIPYGRDRVLIIEVRNGADRNSTGANVPLQSRPGLTPVVQFLGSPDDGYFSVPIGFPFTFGAPLDTVHIGTNGFVSFEESGVTTYVSSPLPDPQPPNALIAGWWDDLDVGFGGAITTTIAGQAPRRVRVVRYEAVLYHLDPVSTVTMEIRLHETGGVFEIHYGSLQLGTMPWSATAGWESTGGVLGGYALSCPGDCTAAGWRTDWLVTFTP